MIFYHASVFVWLCYACVGSRLEYAADVWSQWNGSKHYNRLYYKKKIMINLYIKKKTLFKPVKKKHHFTRHKTFKHKQVTQTLK